jgi:cation diffusion facilitator CzcD-associated flavoprotein CzcO
MIFLDAPRLSALGERMSLRHLRAQVADPELREKLRPHFQFGCKRILVSDDYWASFARANVELVTEPIARIQPSGIETKDGRLHALDAIVLATGFAVGLARAPFPVQGRGGRSLDEAWSRGAVAYKGMAVSGFPNWFILMGPNTGPGHTSVLLFTEAQIEHLLGAIRTLRREGVATVEVRQQVQDRYDAGIQKRMKHMVWTSGCKSWYLSADGSNHALYPGFAAEYVLRTRRFEPRDYLLSPGDVGSEV